LLKHIKNLEGKTISTEIVNITKEYFEQKGINANIEFSLGATEAKVPQFADAIVDLIETGETRRVNQLRILDTILETDSAR
jgi:ATP phosphoribosyltransferase